MPALLDPRRSDIRRWRDAARAHMRKQASLGGDGQDVPFEQALASLAHAYLKDKAPGLLDYEVGFQLMDRSEDNSKAVGVRGFKVGSKLLLAPVFFINGDLKGHELLWIKNDDQFVPLKENWINYLLQKRPLSLGEGIDKDTRRVGVRPPEFNRLVHSPTKFASTLPSWLREGMPGLAYALTTDPYSDPRYDNMRRLPDLLKAGGARMIRSLLKYAEAYPGIARGLDEFYDLPTMRTILEGLRQEKSASVLSGPDVVPRRSAPAWFSGRSVLGEYGPQHPIKTGALQVYTYDTGQLSKVPKTLPEPDAAKLLRERVLIKDDRDDDQVSRAYNVQTSRTLTNPDETGLYDVLIKPDTFEKLLVIVGPHGPDGRKVFATVVRAEGDTKGWINIHQSYIWTSKKYSDEDWSEWARKLPQASELSDGEGQYVLVSEQKRDGTLPFIVEGSVGDPEGYKIFNVRFDMFSARPRQAYMKGLSNRTYFETRLSDDTEIYDRWSNGERIHITGRRGATLRSRYGDVYVPEGFRLLKVEEAEYDDDQWKAPEDDPKTVTRPIKSLTGGKGESKTPPLSPAQMVDVELGLWQQKIGSTIPHDRLRLSYNGISAHINDGPYLNGRDALVSLVRDHGFREKVARQMLDLCYENRYRSGGAARDFRVEYAPWVKQADPYLTGSDAPSAPSIPEAQFGGDPFMGSQVLTQFPQEDMIPVQGMRADPANRDLYRPHVDPDPHAAQVATQAAAQGQREIFDTSILGGLLKVTRDDQLTDQFIPDLMKGMDRLGRILFQIYWHRDAFEERYGKTHVPELEDMLRNSFEDMGDTVLDLRQKTIEADPGTEQRRLDFKSDTNE
jgi:hypothetical protein